MYILPFKPSDRVIELGGGNNPVFPINVDVCPSPKVTIVADLNQPLPIDSESYDGVFSQFLLEHLRPPKLSGFLSEVHRILKSGGVAVIITANLLEQAKALVEREEWNDDLGGNPDYPENCHHSLSPQDALNLFRRAGFNSINIYEHPVAKAIMGRSTDMIIEAHKSGARIMRSL